VNIGAVYKQAARTTPLTKNARQETR